MGNEHTESLSLKYINPKVDNIYVRKLTLEVLNHVHDLKNLNDYKKFEEKVLKVKSYLIKNAVVKRKNSTLILFEGELDFDDLTNFVLKGRGILKEKRLFGEKVRDVNFVLDTKNDRFEANIENEPLIILVVGLYFEFLKNFVGEKK